MSALELLAARVEAIDTHIPQGSDEWLEAKRYTIGGSQIGFIRGEDKYSTMESFARGRMSADRFFNPITYFGTIFEDVLREYMEGVIGARIIGSESFLLGRDSEYGDTPYADCISFSPDGFTVIPGGDGAPRVALVEFKCPYRRIPATEAPRNYVSQVRMGLDMFGGRLGLEVGLLAEAIFRQTTLDWLFTGEYVGNPVPAAITRRLPVAAGIIGIVGPRATAPPASDDDYLVWFLRQIYDGAEYEYLIARDPAEKSRLLAAASGYEHALPWNLYGVEQHYITPVPGFLRAHLPAIKELMDKMQLIMGDDDPETALHDLLL